jgi:DNA-binding CsgD family transcriptional regulator
LEQNPGSPESNGGRCALTERQTEVLSWVARGKTNQEIGKYLGWIFPKLGVENRTAAASIVLGTNGRESSLLRHGFECARAR